jgi:hypothetical protein
MDECTEMMAVAGDSMFTTFKATLLLPFSDACRQTLVLFERAVAGDACTGEGQGESQALKSRVEAVNNACCEKSGENICTKDGGKSYGTHFKQLCLAVSPA